MRLAYHLPPMGLQLQIDEDLKQAMRDKAAQKLGVLRMLKSAVKNLAIEKGEISETEIVVVIRKEISKREDSITSFKAGGREDLAANELAEIEFLKPYLPAGLSEAEVEKIVNDAITETGATTKQQMGAVMKIAQAKAAGRVDNKTLSQLVQKLLK